MSILVVDDAPTQRLALTRILKAEGYTDILVAGSAYEAIDYLHEYGADIDLILTDLNMPELNGIDACAYIKSVEEWQDIPVIMITTSADETDLQQAFEAGAMDYITKPPRRVEMMARVRSNLKLKHEMDKRKRREQELREEKERSDRLLLNILPKPIAERLKHTQDIIADRFEETTVMFIDIADFTPFAAQQRPEDLVDFLNEMFSMFDNLAEKHGLEKIKTIGDAYMVVAGVPMPRPDHAQAIANMALDIQRMLADLPEYPLVRIGIHSGPLVAGVIGQKKFSYDLWGDTVNIASRMESHGCVGKIQVSAETRALLGDAYCFIQREPIQVKGHGQMHTYFLTGKVGMR